MPLTPMSDQDRISLYNIKQTSNEEKEKYQQGDNKLIQVLQTNILIALWCRLHWEMFKLA